MGLIVAIPDTAVEDCSDLRQKTVKLGQLARAFAIFKVERVVVYSTGTDHPRVTRDRELIAKILRYMDTPQYLRKQLFPRSSSLKYAGLLPPLRTRSHPLTKQSETLQEGDVRWGVLDQMGSVDVGLDRPMRCESRLDRQTLYLFRIMNTRPEPTVEVIDRDDVGIYWGFEVGVVTNLIKYLGDMHDYTRVVFSRNGGPFKRIERDLMATVMGTNDLLAVFGSPEQGVAEIFHNQRDLLKGNVEFWINTVPDQGTETVRLEEALTVSLGLLNNSLGDLITRPGFYAKSK